MLSDSQEKNIFHLLQLRYGIIGNSKVMQDAMARLMQTAPTDLTVLITGETGTGKEIFANALHGLSKRKKFPFVSVNCAAIPETLLESELFGHEKGAFTGAIEQRKGFFEVAHHGTIFLDEIGEMPIGTQSKLLRILESGEFTRLGSSSTHKVDVRIIAATNRNIEEEIQTGFFRQDLYFRLKNVQLDLPPLRNRIDDIPILVDYFGKQVCEKLSIKFEGVAPDSINILKTLPWPGNVRELKNLIETIITLEQTSYITPEIISRYIAHALPPHDVTPMARDKSLIYIPEPEGTKKFELGIIFRTLLELRNELSEIKRIVEQNTETIEYLRENLPAYQANIAEENPESVDIMEKIDNIRLDEMEKKLILKALKQFDGNRRSAADALGISERTLYRKINDYNL